MIMSTLVLPQICDQSGYAGKDLEAMAFAVNYHRWILSTFEPFLGTRIVEVGAGTGSFSELLVERRSESLSLVEPSEAMYKRLCQRIKELAPSITVKTYNEVFEEVADNIRAQERPDSIIYVNVLEHIADDLKELQVISRTLETSGRLFIFVPALSWLYGSFDRQINHFRRYTRTELEKKCCAAGLRVISSRYFDLLGVLPWWVKYRLLQSKKIEPRAVKFYDQHIVPIARTFESWVNPPLGKNILLIAEKTALS
jgi:SAM-dependent methyltransferase